MVHTILQIVDSNGKKIYSYKTQRFTETTTTKDIVTFILQKSNKFKPPLHIEIQDQPDGDFVTLDDDYLAEYEPFNPNNVDTTTGRVTNLPGKTVKLKITLLDYDCLSTISQAVVKTTEGLVNFKALEFYQIFRFLVLSTSIQQTEETYHGDQSLSTSEASAIPTIELSEDPKMGFVPGHNVNDIQRDQYISDAKNVATGKITGKLAKIQANRELQEKYASKLPKIKKDGVLLCETSVLSDEMNFGSTYNLQKTSKFTLAPPSNASTDTAATTSQSNKSKRRNTSNQRSKRAKRVTVSSSNNNTSYPTFHPDLPVLFTTSQMSDTVFQGSSDNIPSSLEPPLSLGSGWGGLFDSIDGTDS
ncbi:unnamed protein product [Rotaria socialis]